MHFSPHLRCCGLTLAGSQLLPGMPGWNGLPWNSLLLRGLALRKTLLPWTFQVFTYAEPGTGDLSSSLPCHSITAVSPTGCLSIHHLVPKTKLEWCVVLIIFSLCGQEVIWSGELYFRPFPSLIPPCAHPVWVQEWLSYPLVWPALDTTQWPVFTITRGSCYMWIILYFSPVMVIIYINFNLILGLKPRWKYTHKNSIIQK